MKKGNKKKILLTSCFIILFCLLGSLFSGLIIHENMFNKVKRPDYSITPGLVNYEEIDDKIDRIEYNFYSNDNKLTGYYYPCDNAKALIVISHGLNDGADSMLSEILFFNQNDYSVFAYDYSGCFDSEGKLGGFYQSLIDLNNALQFINSLDELNDYKILLFGFSLGGYASTSIFNLTSNNIYGSVSISGFNDAKNIFFENAKKKVGPLMYLGKPLCSLLINNRYKDYLSCSAIKGINNTSTPLFIINSKKDEVISYKDSIVYLKDEVINPNVTYHIDESNTHTSILYSKEAINYQNEVDSKLSKITNNKEKKSYIASVNDELYSQLNESLFNNILSFYNNCL